MVTECCDEAGIDPADTIVVGDAIYDMQMAKSAGARAIGVALGLCLRAGAYRLRRRPCGASARRYLEMDGEAACLISAMN